MAINSRKAACDAVLRILNGGYSNLIINQILKDNNVQEKDKAFITALVYGTVERKITLDHIIEKASGRLISKIDDIALSALRIGVYQLLFMDKVPESAAVNESVKIVKASKKPFLSGFVNAVLRNVQRQKTALWPIEPTNSVKDLSLAFSCSEDIVKLLVQDYGFETTKEFLSSSIGAAGVTIRVNTLKTNSEELMESFGHNGISAERAELENVLRVKNQNSLESDKRFKSGLFHVQDVSSAICAETVAPKEGDRILDICAAPGGKTFTMAEIANDSCEIVACDIHEHRVQLILKGAERLGLKSVKTTVLDATEEHSELGLFDKILCDVPCSGIGVIGRKPEIKYHSDKELAGLPEIQFNILNNAAKLLKKGGRIVYSTCTVLKRENEAVFAKFLKQNADFKKVSVKTYLPHIDKTDGFFVAVAERV